jgi:20S proteasome alpha/beta subunit
VNGRLPDGRNLVKRARSESEEYSKNFGIPIEGTVLIIEFQILSERIA